MVAARMSTLSIRVHWDTIGRLVWIASQTPRYGPWFLIKLSLSLTARDWGHWDFGDSSSW